MALNKEDIFKIMKTNLSKESLLLMTTIQMQNSAIAKEELWHKANEFYSSQQASSQKLIGSRYTLDIHTARLEGAGLVDLRIYGRIRTYTISPLGKEFWEYLNS